ncbi:MAG: MFS transporter [Succinivibrio sp.]|nr:MFS transporter [Succinivibrio sp.]
MSLWRRNLFTLTFVICFIYSLNGGLRGNCGVLMAPLCESSGLNYADVSFIMAVCQLLFGVLQPLFGVLALKSSERVVLIGGALMLTAGFALTPFCRSFVSLLFAFGILVGSGCAAVSFGMLLAVVARQVKSTQTNTVSGLLNASSGVGTTVLAPLLQYLCVAVGLLGTMFFLGVPALLIIPLTLWLCAKKAGAHEDKALSTSQGQPENELKVSDTGQDTEPEAKTGALAMLREALRDRTYLFLLLGFGTCGFHMAILETHFFSELTLFGISRSTASFIFALYGIFTVLGSALSGLLCNHLPMRLVLGSIYGMRVFLVLIVLVIPSSVWALALFTVFLGLSSDSTVSPTVGLILRHYGVRKMATLFGLTFVTHQSSAFVSAALGGVLAESAGGFTVLWLIDAVLALGASLLSYSVREHPVSGVQEKPLN